MPHIISLINLWCTKNLVDSQFLLGKLLTSPDKDVAYSIDPYDPEVELVFLNTCGFISSGREETFQTLDKLLAHGKKVCLIGCAVQYFEKVLPLQTPFRRFTPPSPLSGGNAIHGSSSCVFPWQEEVATTRNEEETEGFVRQKILTNPNISLLSRNDLKNASIPTLLKGFKSQTFQDFEWLDTPRALTNLDNKFEYLKIAEGCNNSCSFCIIPKIRGKQISLPLPKIIEEVHNLVSQGAEEIILIAQDSTRYGSDLYGKPQLFELLEEIEHLEGDFRYRVLYLYPDLLTLHQLKKLTSFKKFIPYFDIPLQHTSSPVLQRMGRFYDEQAIYTFLDFIKAEFPIHFIRTNFIIGFPWETEEDFERLLEFVKKDYFDNIALFEYHDEPLAQSSLLPDKVPEKVLHSRFREIRSLVNQLLLDRSQARKGIEMCGYVQEIYQEKKQILLSVRPWLHCPDIDEVDDISLEQVVSCEDEEVGIGSKVKYVV